MHGTYDFQFDPAGRDWGSMTAFVLLNILLIFFTVVANNHPDTWGRFMPEGQLLWLFVGIFVGAVMAFIAYFNDFTRGYYIAVVFVLTFASVEFMRAPLVFLIGGTLVLIPGVFLLERFLRQHPLPNDEVAHDRS